MAVVEQLHAVAIARVNDQKDVPLLEDVLLVLRSFLPVVTEAGGALSRALTEVLGEGEEQVVGDPQLLKATIGKRNVEMGPTRLLAWEGVRSAAEGDLGEPPRYDPRRVGLAAVKDPEPHIAGVGKAVPVRIEDVALDLAVLKHL
jgi:hypothetical protein